MKRISAASLRAAVSRGMFATLSAILLLSLSGCQSVQKRTQSSATNNERIEIPGGQKITALIRSTLGATARAPISSTWSGVLMLNDRINILLHGLTFGAGINAGKYKNLPAQAGGPEFEAYLDEQGLPAMTSGSVEFFMDGKTYFPELLRSIDAAQSQVDIQTYIFDNDPFAISMADTLKKKSFNVPVRVYTDALGSEMAGKKKPKAVGENPPKGPVMHRYLEEGSNIHVRRFLNPWLVSDHTKLHLIDQRIAYVGGMNLGWEYRYEWNDMMVRLEGPVVEHLVYVFESHWRSADWMRNWGLKWTGRPKMINPPINRDRSQDIPLRLLLTDGSSGGHDILEATTIAIRSASKRVWIQSPYFTNDHIIVELEDAARRGVDVRVVAPGENDSGIMESANAASLLPLLKAGGKVYTYPGMTHLKAAVFDDWASFGSSNYDTLSQKINHELNLASSHPTLLNGLVQKVFQPDFRKSQLMTEEQLSEISGGAVAELIGDQL